MKQLHRDDLFAWSEFDEARNLDFNSVAWIRSGGNVLVDPLPMSAHDFTHLQELGGAAHIVLTTSDHLRDGEALAGRLEAELIGPVAERATFPVACSRWVGDGDEVVPGLVAMEMHGSKTPGELVLLLENSTVITGDLVRGQCGGRLNLLPDAKLTDVAAARDSVGGLGERSSIETVLVGDGWHVFAGGAAALRTMLASLLMVAGCLLGSCAAVPEPPDRKPPNIVVIFMDDMGYADIGSFGATGYKTPHLDRMAREGRRFTDFYVTQAVCSASRAGLLTGCYNVRVGILGALGPKSRIGLHDDEVTIAEICKQKGYATACYGKWHLGHREPFLPMQHGFDDYFGLPYSNDMWPYHPGVVHLPMEKRIKRWPHLPLIDKNTVVNAQVTAKDQEQLTTQYTERAVAFIEKQANAERPFFLYVPHSMVHVPLFVSEKFKGKSGAGLFGDVMMEVDWSVGQILDTLRKHDLDENTLVIFTSDNGPWLSYGDHAGSAAPLREGKGTMFDGGCREPTIMWWPGRVPAGTTCKAPAMTIDILPTVAELIGAELPKHPIDGKSIWPLIAGEPGAKSPQEAYYFYYGRQLQAIRAGRFKLHFPHGYRTMAGRPGGTGGKPNGYKQERIGLSLFDLDSDIGETQDVKGQHPEVVAHMQALGERMRQDLGDQSAGKRVKGVGARAVGRWQPPK